MKKILAGAMTILALGVNEPVFADSNTKTIEKKGKTKITTVLEESSNFLYQEKIEEFEQFFQEDILIEYREDHKYFWEYFGYVSDPDAKAEDVVTDVLGKNLEEIDIFDLLNTINGLAFKFGENGYKAYYDYLFLISLEETWNMESPLFQIENTNDYFTLTGDLVGYFFSVGFELVGNIDSFDRFTFRKSDDGNIEMISILDGGDIETIGKLTSEKISIIKNKAYSIMNFILGYKNKAK